MLCDYAPHDGGLRAVVCLPCYTGLTLGLWAVASAGWWLHVFSARRLVEEVVDGGSCGLRSQARWRLLGFAMLALAIMSRAAVMIQKRVFLSRRRGPRRSDAWDVGPDCIAMWAWTTITEIYLRRSLSESWPV